MSRAKQLAGVPLSRKLLHGCDWRLDPYVA